MSKKQNKMWESAIVNNRTYIDIVNRLTELAINVYKWENLPDTVDERFLELTLNEKGYCLYFRDDIIGDIALTCTIGGRLDIYRVPIERVAFASNGYNLPRDSSNSVLIFNNYLHTPTMTTIELYALRLYEIQRAIDVNIKAQKTPIMVLSTEQQRLSLKQLFMKYDGNEPFIFGNKDLDYEGLKVLNTEAPFVADKLHAMYRQEFNNYLTFLGIENNSIDKKERMTAEEIGGNAGNIEVQRYIGLNARRQACNKINKMFGTNITVKFNSDMVTPVNTPYLMSEGLQDE